jgi:hypothetical protein
MAQGAGSMMDIMLSRLLLLLLLKLQKRFP